MNRRKPTVEQRALFPEAPTQPSDPRSVRAAEEAIVFRAGKLAARIAALPLDAKVRALNEVRRVLHEVSPFRDEPVDLVLWVQGESVEGNPWNPNVVSRPEYVALTHSIATFGYTTAIVGVVIERVDGFLRIRVSDGFHRHRVGRENAAVRARCHGYLPVTLLSETLTTAEQMSATVLHNKARGEHRIEAEIPLVAAMAAEGWDDARIGLGLVKSGEELIRLRQTGGIAQKLANVQYDRAWTWETGEKK